MFLFPQALASVVTGRMLSAVCYRKESDQASAVTGGLPTTAVSAHLSDTPADHILVPISTWSFYLKPAGRKHRQSKVPQPCRQSRAQRTSPAPFPSGRHWAPLPQPPQSLLWKSRLETGLSTGKRTAHFFTKWVQVYNWRMTGIDSVLVKSHNFIKLFQDCKLCVKMNQTLAIKCHHCVTSLVVSKAQKDKVLCKLCIAKVIHLTLVIMVCCRMKLHYVNISNFFPLCTTKIYSIISLAINDRCSFN